MTANIAFPKFSRDYTALKKTLPIRPDEMGVLNETQNILDDMKEV